MSKLRVDKAEELAENCESYEFACGGCCFNGSSYGGRCTPDYFRSQPSDLDEMYKYFLQNREEDEDFDDLIIDDDYDINENDLKDIVYRKEDEKVEDLEEIQYQPESEEARKIMQISNKNGSELGYLAWLFVESQKYEESERWTEKDYKETKEKLFERMWTSGKNFFDDDEQKEYERYVNKREEVEQAKRHEEFLKEQRIKFNQKMREIEKEERIKEVIKSRAEKNKPSESGAYREPVRLHKPEKQKQKKKYVSRAFGWMGDGLSGLWFDISEWVSDKLEGRRYRQRRW